MIHPWVVLDTRLSAELPTVPHQMYLKQIYRKTETLSILLMWKIPLRKRSRRKPGTVSAEQMYGVKLSQENKNEDFAEWAEKEDAKKKKAAEKEATLAEKQKNADNSNLTNREKYSLSKQEATEIKKGVSVITDADNNTIIDIKSNILENIPKEDWLKRVKNVIRSVFPKGFNLNGEHIDVSAKSR